VQSVPTGANCPNFLVNFILVFVPCVKKLVAFLNIMQEKLVVAFWKEK
jgi:hypothetical protein